MTLDDLTSEEINKKNTIEASSVAVHQHLGAFAVSMLDLHPNGRIKIGSGTLIDVCGHLLVATAAHCIPDQPDGRLWLLTSTPKRTEDGMITFMNWKVDRVKDVGLLELEPAMAWSYFGAKEACPLERVRPAGTGRERALVSLIGSPGERVDASGQHQGLPSMVARVDGFTGMVLSPDDWRIPPGVPETPVRSINVAVEYPDEVSNLLADQSMRAYHPGGFSGGGIWDQHVTSEGVWSSQKATLYAFLSYWYADKFPDYRNLFGIQIIHWLRLVRDHYPDIRAELEDRIPELKVP